MKKLFLNALILSFLLVSLVSFAYAAEHGEGGHHEGGLMSIKFYAINFFIYAAFIFTLAKKKLPGAWSSRRARLESAIFSSREKITAMEKTYSEAKSKLDSIKVQIDEFEKSVKDETKREVEEIRTSAELAVQRIEKQVKDTLSAEQRNLEKSMRKIYAEAALKIAEEKLKSQININTDKQLRDKAISSMKGLLQ